MRSAFASHLCWFEPIENAVRAAQQAREALIAGGDLAWAGYAYQPSVACLLDCAPTLHVYIAEVDAGLAFVRRTGNETTAGWLDSYRWVAEALCGRGRGVDDGRDSTAAAGDEIPLDRHAGNPAALLYGHIARAMAAAIFEDEAGPARHATAAMSLLTAAPGHYPTAIAHVLRGLALAAQARAGDGDRGGEALPELDGVTAWLAARAADAPEISCTCCGWSRRSGPGRSGTSGPPCWPSTRRSGRWPAGSVRGTGR